MQRFVKGRPHLSKVDERMVANTVYVMMKGSTKIPKRMDNKLRFMDLQIQVNGN